MHISKRESGHTWRLDPLFDAGYEDIYLKAYGSMAEVKKGLGAYFPFYNERLWHQSFDRKTPAMIYFSTLPQKQAAA